MPLCPQHNIAMPKLLRNALVPNPRELLLGDNVLFIYKFYERVMYQTSVEKTDEYFIKPLCLVSLRKVNGVTDVRNIRIQ